MNIKYPYQLVAFLDKEPAIREPVYYGVNGWYSPIALKRRFKLCDMEEDDLLSALSEHCDNKTTFTINIAELIQPQRIPAKVLGVEATPEHITFHNNPITFIGKALQSRYPERDSTNYLPHITAEYMMR
jgi:hypothetical protein